MARSMKKRVGLRSRKQRRGRAVRIVARCRGRSGQGGLVGVEAVIQDGLGRHETLAEIARQEFGSQDAGGNIEDGVRQELRFQLLIFQVLAQFLPALFGGDALLAKQPANDRDAAEPASLKP
jgi:hypothetical protein